MAGFEGQPSPVSAAGVTLLAPVAPEPSPVRRARPTRRLIVGVAGLVLGLLLILVGSVLDLSGQQRLVVILAGVVSLYLGGVHVGRYLFGEHFDLALWLSIFWLVSLVTAAITANLLPLAESKDISKTLTTPTLLRPDLFSAHPLGTDRQGLDILGGIIYGARVSLVVSLGAVALGMLVGGLIGMAAGYYRGRLDGIVGLLSDAMLAFPPLILLLALAAMFTPSTRNVTLALAVLGIPIYIRLSRANTLVFAQREFVLSARVLGAKNTRIIFRDILPNVLLPVLSYSAIVVGALIVAEASLSFLGLSVPRPQPTWGNMIAAGQDDFDRNPQLVFIPSTVLFFTVFSLNRVGEKARQIWDPRGSRL